MSRIIAIVLALALGGCAQFATSLHNWSLNFQSGVADINADIAAIAPDVALGCRDLQAIANLILPYAETALANAGKAPQYLSAANGALRGYCTAIPTDIPSTIAALSNAYKQAAAGYSAVSGKTAPVNP